MTLSFAALERLEGRQPRCGCAAVLCGLAYPGLRGRSERTATRVARLRRSAPAPRRARTRRPRLPAHQQSGGAGSSLELITEQRRGNPWAITRRMRNSACVRPASRGGRPGLAGLGWPSRAGQAGLGRGSRPSRPRTDGTRLQRAEEGAGGAGVARGAMTGPPAPSSLRLAGGAGRGGGAERRGGARGSPRSPAAPARPAPGLPRAWPPPPARSSSCSHSSAVCVHHQWIYCFRPVKNGPSHAV